MVNWICLLSHKGEHRVIFSAFVVVCGCVYVWPIIRRREDICWWVWQVALFCKGKHAGRSRRRLTLLSVLFYVWQKKMLDKVRSIRSTTDRVKSVHGVVQGFHKATKGWDTRETRARGVSVCCCVGKKKKSNAPLICIEYKRDAMTRFSKYPECVCSIIPVCRQYMWTGYYLYAVRRAKEQTMWDEEEV